MLYSVAGILAFFNPLLASSVLTLLLDAKLVPESVSEFVSL